jgi:hypothetical protein
MMQRPIVAYLSLKGMSAREIHDDIVATLGPDPVSYSSVIRYLGEARFPPLKPEPHPADVQRDRDIDDSDQVILAALEDSPLASVQQLSRLAHLPSTTVYRRLIQSLGFVARPSSFNIISANSPLDSWPKYDVQDSPYVYMDDGTSTACPKVAGAVAFIIECLREYYGIVPSSSLLKAILILSAGPIDPVVGYGGFNASEPRIRVRAGELCEPRTRRVLSAPPGTKSQSMMSHISWRL